MSFDPQPDDGQAPARSRRPLLLLAGALLLVAAFLAGRVLAPLVRGGPRPGPPTTEVVKPVEEHPAPVAESTAPPPVAVDAPPAPRTRARRKADAPPPATSEPAAPTTGELQIESDVPGAIVFLDRVYLGTTPVTAQKVAPGPHQLNVSAEGHDGYSETLIVEPGRREITVRFKEIRLNEAIAVVHKHGVGSCDGRLVADPKGVRYESPNREDAFSLAFADIETFEVDYLKKNLRVKRRGGKTWNFTTKAENADPLFVFHRNVDKVRQQVAGGAPPRGK